MNKVKIKVVIIDDDNEGVDILLNILTKYFSDKIIISDICNTVSSGVEAIIIHKPNLVFLDIQLLGEDGLPLCEYFESPDFDVVITTVMDDFAIYAIKHAVFDYLLKPLKYADLKSTINRYELKKSIVSEQKNISFLLENMSANFTEFNKIAIPTNDGFDLVKIETIIYCQSNNNYCNIITLGGKNYLMSKTLKYVEDLIDSNFFIRIHKSYLVNLNHIIKFDKVNDLTVTLINKEKLPVSVRKKDLFLKAIMSKNKNKSQNY